ncbi:MAG: SGNH/GDSL hydrolase family protein [Oscillospiraceae bacterium]
MVKKICMFGDSIAKGVIIDEARGRYAGTKRSFANIISEAEPWISLKNYSMLGCTVSKGQSLLARHLADVQDCDLVVLEYGGNDSDHNWAEVASSPESAHLPKTPIGSFAEIYQEIIDVLRDMGKKIVMLNLPPIHSNKYFAWFGGGLDRGSILQWLGGSEDAIFKFHEKYNSCVCKLAAENGVPLVDIRSAFLNLPDYSDYLCADGIHPNEAGHQLIARVISENIPGLTKLFAPLPMAVSCV